MCVPTMPKKAATKRCRQVRAFARLGAIFVLCAHAGLAMAQAPAPSTPTSSLPTSSPPVDSAALRNEAFENAQRAMSGAAANALAQLGVRFAAGSGELAKAVRARQDLIETWRASDRQLTQALAAQNGFINIGDLRARVDKLQNDIAASDRDLARRFPAYADLALPKPISLSATQTMLDADEAMVLILVGNKESFVFALTRDEVTVARVDVKSLDLLARIKSLRRGLNPSSPAVMRSGMRNFGDSVLESGGEAPQNIFDRTSAYEIYSQFLAPVDRLIASRRRVFFVLEQPFDSLPLALLVTKPPQGQDTDPAALRNTAWLLKRQAIVVLPSVASLKALRSGPAVARAPEPFRGYGAPAIGQGSERMLVATRSAGTAASVYKEGRIDVEAVRALQALPKTEGELKRLAAALRAPANAVRVGSAATVTAVKADQLSRYRVIAFATHGLLAGELAGLAEPALVFTPPKTASDNDNGLLTASEAAKLQLAADWVILSACNTASGDGTPGADGLSGLARAFFYAGAKSLLVSHWPVRDDAAARITTETFKALAANSKLAKADAFRQAVLALMNDPSDPTFAHPAIWAPFIVVGEGR